MSTFDSFTVGDLMTTTSMSREYLLSHSLNSSNELKNIDRKRKLAKD